MRATTSSDAPAAETMITTGSAAGMGQRPVALLLGGWVAVALGIATHDGRYALPSLALVVGGTALVGAGVIAAARVRAGASVRWVPAWLPRLSLAAAALAVGLSPLIWHPRYFAHGAGWTASQVLAALAGVLAAATVLPTFGRLRFLAERSWPFWAALGLMSAAGATMIAAAGKPHIDVFWLLQGSTKGLVSGADMYRQQWAETRASYPSHGLFDVYPYLPWTSVLLLPFRLVFGDVRYGLVTSLAVAAFVARRLGTGAATLAGRPTRYLPALLPLLIALHPKVTYADQLAWTEPLLVALLTGMVLAAVRGRTGVAVACLALALASKQHIVLLLPITALWPRFGLRRTLISAGSALLLISPWIIAGPRDFWHDAVDANLGLGYRSDALCIATWVHKTFGHDPGFALTAVGLLAAYALAWRVRGDAFGFCAGAGLLVLMLDITNTQSFFNHYTLGMALVVLAVIVGTSGADPRTRSATAEGLSLVRSRIRSATPAAG
jgi:hypothetical protein